MYFPTTSNSKAAEVTFISLKGFLTVIGAVLVGWMASASLWLLVWTICLRRKWKEACSRRRLGKLRWHLTLLGADSVSNYWILSVILVGNKGDEGGHPAWAKDGSFMVFRTYEQKVPEFTMYAVLPCVTSVQRLRGNILMFSRWCAGNIPNVQRLSELNDEERAQALYELRLFSSRVVGRWPEGKYIQDKNTLSDVITSTVLTSIGKPGAPLELHPTKDPNPIRDADPVLSQQKLREEWGAEADKKFAELERTNKTDNFNYDPKDQTRCPFASHIRKCGPRNDHPGYVKHLMLRRGIPYGPMTTPAEKQGGISQVDRGLLFVSYQSSITNGFRTIQKGMYPEVSYKRPPIMIPGRICKQRKCSPGQDQCLWW